MGEENKKTTEQTIETQTQDVPNLEQKPTIDNSTVELEASKQLLSEKDKTIETLQKELMDAKVANAKLIMQTPVTQVREAEEILNDMFK